MDRRTLLSNLGAVGTVAIAGCSNSDESATPEGTEPTESETSEEDPQTAQNTETATPEEGTGAASPEEAVRGFSTALQNGNVSRANELLHPGSNIYPIEETAEDPMNFVEVQQLSESDLAERIQRNSNVTSEEVEQSIQQLDENFSAFEEYAVFSIEIEASGTTVSEIGFAVKDNGNWYYWGVQ
jgi:hypothetical protein